MAKRLIATAAIGHRIAGGNAPAEKGFRCQATRGSRQRTTACHAFSSLRGRGHRSEKWGSRRWHRQRFPDQTPGACALASKRTQILVVTNSALLADAFPLLQEPKRIDCARSTAVTRRLAACASRRAYFVKERVDTVIVTGCNTSGCIRATSIDSFSHKFRTIVPEDCSATSRSSRTGTISEIWPVLPWADLSCLPREMAQKERALRYS